MVVPDARRSKNNTKVDDIKRGNRNVPPVQRTESPQHKPHGNFNMNQFMQSGANPR